MCSSHAVSVKRFSSRLIFCTAAPAALFVLALVGSQWGLTRTQNDFNHYLSHDQVVVSQLQELYAQGLQSGQALRNIVLDPSDQKAVENLQTARQAYDSAYADVRQRAQGTSLAPVLQHMQTLRDTQSQAQDKVVQLASQDYDSAAAVLKNEETPAWRALRKALLDELQQSRQAASASHQATREAAQRMQLWSALLAVTAVLVALGLLWVMVRTLRSELGGDPAEARLALRRVADGDLTDDGAHGRAQGLMADLQTMRRSLRELVQRVHGASVQMHHASSEIAQGNADLSSRTESQASALEETAASMEQLNVNVRQNADNAQAANQLAQSASQVAQQGGAVVARMVTTMQDIHSSSHRIADIIGVIDAIAFQTNILALNAAVEAARAGEQGRGFAVVAAEVRQLAMRAGEAAREIKGLIATSAQNVETGTALVNGAGHTMGQIVDSIRNVASMISDISTTTLSQTRDINDINTAVARLDQMTQQNSALVEESAAASEGLRHQANELTHLISQFVLPPQHEALPMQGPSRMAALPRP